MKKLLALLALLLFAPLASAGSVTIPFDTGYHAPRSAYGYQNGQWVDHLYTTPLAPPDATSATLSYTSWTRRTLRAINHSSVPRHVVVHGATNNTNTKTSTSHETWCSPSVGVDGIPILLAPGEIREIDIEYQGGNALPITINPAHLGFLKSRRAKYANTYLYEYVVLTIDGVWTQSSGGLVNPDEWESLGLYFTDVWGEPETAPDPETRFWGTLTYETP